MYTPYAGDVGNITAQIGEIPYLATKKLYQPGYTSITSKSFSSSLIDIDLIPALAFG
jgi:hypothetical protein